MNLIIVESPTKARTFNRILQGKDYYVFATLGHIRDLPADKIAIDYKKKFKPDYHIIKIKSKVVAQLKELESKNNQIILATDPDREGESISYHAAYLMGFIKENWPDFSISDTKGRLKRIVFHEITQKALNEALENPTELRFDLIKAQQARRILDRVVGYELSPLLWKKTGKNWLSAGRVQTVAVRLIVEREKEIKTFAKEKYFQVYGDFINGLSVRAKLIKKDGVPFEQSTKLQLFDGDYEFTKTTISGDNLPAIKTDLETDTYSVTEIIEEIKKRFPPPPFTTSLLQQDGFNKFGFSSKMVMKLAQDLYERGLITYHRTDSFNLSTNFVFRAKDYITATYGREYALEKPRGYKTKSKLAQEAHEAIRPTNLNKTVEELFAHKDKSKSSGLTVNHKKLYQLILNRSLATQMKEAEVKTVKVFIVSGRNYLFEADFQQVIFDGFLKVLNPEYVAKNSAAVSFSSGHPVKLTALEPVENDTLPPPRYNEASLIKTMEEKGIGRPSTYAPIISLIQEKGYVDKDGRYFIPTPLGTAISDYLSKSFPELFDINFTAAMEENLDNIANGQGDAVTLLSQFYQPFKKQLEEKKIDNTKVVIDESSNEPCPKCGKPLITRYSKFGKFIACSGYPGCKFTKPFLKVIANQKCPECGGNIVVKYSKNKKRFYGCSNYPNCHFMKWTLKQ